MSIDAQRLKATRGLVGKACKWCGLPIAAGEDTAVCIACDFPHHTSCWKKYGGCGWSGCMNEPVSRQETSPTPRRILPPEKIYCPRCGGVLPRDLPQCPHCRSSTGRAGATPSTRYHARVVVQEATNALIMGCIGLLVCGFLLGPCAILSGRNALRRIQTNRARGDTLYVGDGSARAGMFLGVVATVLHTGLLILYILALCDPERFNPYLPVQIPEDFLDQVAHYLFGDWRIVID